ncbi:MAG: FtsW/RodA/SpoVE family cell cycle protein [Bacilli bacterium]|nr:FtsW/RodA/SpoVE family cell cycle protein [Bacilli bacterium]
MGQKKFKLDFSILSIILIFAVISIATIYSASTYISSDMGNLVLKQSVWYVVGFAVVFLILKFKNNFFYEHSFLFYIIGCILLLLLLFFGTPINNSKCWFTIPGIGSFQPSEFMKIFIMLFLGVMICNFRKNYESPTVMEEFVFILKTLGVVLVPSVLTFLQPDTGAVIIYFIIYLCMMFASGIRFRWFVIAFLFVGCCLGGVLALYLLNGDLFIDIFGTKLFYRLDRIFQWQDGTGLQLENALAAIGSAGFLGHGFNSTPIYFPESGTDFIFAVFASNFGFLGAALLVMLICFFDIKLIMLVKKKKYITDKFVLTGIIGMLVFQQVQNIGMTIGLFPITGITLPFISYGGSSLLSYMIMVGIILNIAGEKDRNYKYSY